MEINKPQSIDFEDDDSSETEFYRTFHTEINNDEELIPNEDESEID